MVLYNSVHLFVIVHLRIVGISLVPALLCTTPRRSSAHAMMLPFQFIFPLFILPFPEDVPSCRQRQPSSYARPMHGNPGRGLACTILALPGPNSTIVLGPGKRACKIASRSLWPGFASANQLSVWNASPQLLIHDHLPFSSSVILKDRAQNSRSWRSQVKSTNQITRNQGNTGHTRRHHNQASRIFNMTGWW